MSDKEIVPDELIIPVELAQRVVNYLATRPYGDVFQLIQAMQTLEPASLKVKD